MSRKTNQLRKRLRVRELQLGKQRRIAARLKRELCEEKRRCDPENGSIVLLWERNPVELQKWRFCIDVWLNNVPLPPRLREHIMGRLKRELIKIFDAMDR